MGFFLLENATAIPQCRYPRRVRTPGLPTLSGAVVVHVVESVMDTVGIDTGAENTAQFIKRRTDYGSYHEIHDQDSVVFMAPDDYETWHVGADAHNWHAWGISAACRTTDWNPAHPWTRAVLASMGRSICAFWIRNGFDPVQLARRWGTRDQGLRQEPGLYLHGVLQPLDRSDAWRDSPHRPALEVMLSDAILVAAGATPQPPPSGGFTMSQVQEIIDADSGFHTDTRRYVPPIAVKVAGDPAQYLIVTTDSGLARQHLSGELKSVLRKARMVSDIGKESGHDFVELSDPGEVAAFLALPVV